MPRNFPYILENIEILDAGAEGKAIARHNNKVIFVPYASPGDIVDIRVRRRKKKFLEAEIVKIHKKSELRTDAFCSHFGVCGGCKWQHMQYDAQLKLKQKQITDHIQRIGKFEVDKINPIIAADPTKYYRNKLEFTFSYKGWRENEAFEALSEEEKLADYNVLGFHVPGFYDKILDIDHCYLQAEPSNEIRLFVKDFAIKNGFVFHNIREHDGFLRNIVIRTSSTGDLMVNFIFHNNDKEKIKLLLDAVKKQFPQITSLNYFINNKTNDSHADLVPHNYSGKPYILEKMNDLSFQIGAKSFYQTNSQQAHKLYKIALDYAELTGMELVYDLYTGTGTIANFVASKADRVVGIEYVEEAVVDAKHNSKLNNISNTDYVAGDMAKILNADFVSKYGNPHVIITDPPRAGMHPKVVEQMLKIKANKIVYISCNSATQARDVALMQEEYTVVKSQAVDMFPQTHHVENVMLLEKRK
jgi:23S rRNA (uracil1939-C5)-methyltransferase